MVRVCLAIALLALTGCVADSMAPAGFRVVVADSQDSVWTARPGADTAIRVRVMDAEGAPVRGATILWVPDGTGSNVADAAIVSDRDGYAVARWRIGTDAADHQTLRVTARSARSTYDLVVRGRVVPSEVIALRIDVDTLVIRFGDTLAMKVMAVDPFGNVFAAPDLVLRAADSGIASLLESSFVMGTRRGATLVTAVSAGHALRVPVRVVQYVSRIEPMTDSLWFTSLGTERPVEYVVLDDRGRVVADTAAEFSLGDSTIVHVAGGQARSLKTGITSLHLTIGTTRTTMIVGVEQRVASLALLADTIGFDALLDTMTLHPVARDSMGVRILHPSLVYHASDSRVVSVLVGGTLIAVAPGTTVATARDLVTGIVATAVVVVRQRVTSIELAPMMFDALGDTQRVVATARDRLGSVVAGSVLEVAVTDEGVAVALDGEVRSVGPGRTQVHARDRESGYVTTSDVTVAQRVVRLALDADSLEFDALGDTAALPFMAWDRLGARVVDAVATYSSSDSTIVAVAGDGLILSRDNGAAWLVARAADGAADSVPAVVAQRVTRTAVTQDSVLLEALSAVRAVPAAAVDRRGFAVRGAPLSYAVVDTTIVAVDAAGQVRALANGRTRVLVLGERDTVAVELRVLQRPTAVVMSRDTIHFDALGDAQTVSGVAMDSLGSPVAGAGLSLVSNDASIVAADSLTLRAAGNGATRADVVVGMPIGYVTVVVNQVARSLMVSVSEPVVRRAAGALMPLQCEALDRNGFTMAAASMLVGSAKGTVTGVRCDDTRVVRSGYDTLTFALGDMRAVVPVIVATAPDSVGVLVAAHELSADERTRFRGEDFNHPSIRALRPLVTEILAAYGNPVTNLDRARALRDWVSRTAVHPYSLLHPEGSTSNLSVLPPGATWLDANWAAYWKIFEDTQYWGSVGMDGYAMLNRLLGTLDPVTGQRAADGMMEHVAGARYRIRDLETYRYVLCSYQDIILTTIWAAAGLHGMLISTVGHDPAAVFIPELGRWVYEDPEWNEEFVLDDAGDPLSPTALLELTSAGQAGRLTPRKLPGPVFDPETYVATDSYLNYSAGILLMGSQLNSRIVGIGGWPMQYVQIDVPMLEREPVFSDTKRFVRVQPQDAFPTLGVVVQQVTMQDSVFVVHLGSTYPSHDHFERRIDDHAWEMVSNIDVLPVGACRVSYRSVDVVGTYSATAVLDVWAPRADGFLESADPGSIRGSGRSCW